MKMFYEYSHFQPLELKPRFNKNQSLLAIVRDSKGKMRWEKVNSIHPLMLDDLQHATLV